MEWRLLDKLLVFLMVVSVILLDTRGEVIGPEVVAILISLIILTFTEIKRGALWAIASAVLLASSVFFYPLMSAALPCAAYALVSSDKLLKDRRRDFLAKFVLAVALGLLSFTSGKGIQYAIVIIAISVVGIYMAIKSDRYEESSRMLIDKYDEARLASVNARRLSEETIKNADNEIYVARLKERNRIAREIHDNVGHMITRVIVQLQAIRIINKDEVVGEQLESVGQTLDLAMTGIRKSVHELHDDSIDLAIGVNEITKAISDRFEVSVKTFIESPADNNIKNAVLGIIKEAVTNISKYSKGDKVFVEVTENNTFWRVKIEDNGSNPPRELDLSDDSLSDGSGIGLKNIAARAGNLGGRASIISGSDGFTVLATLPKERTAK